jgi:hypothetical protein
MDDILPTFRNGDQVMGVTWNQVRSQLGFIRVAGIFLGEKKEGQD